MPTVLREYLFTSQPCITAVYLPFPEASRAVHAPLLQRAYQRDTKLQALRALASGIHCSIYIRMI